MIIFNIDIMLARRKMTLTELSEKAGITMARRGYPFTVIPRDRYIPAAARAEASVPTRKSKGSAPAKLRLNSRHPKDKPGMAAGVNSASTHSASDARNWIAIEAELGMRKF